MSSANSASTRGSADSRLVARNSFILLIRNGIIWALNLILVLFLPRYLGADGLGQLQFAMSFVTLFSTIVALGMRSYIIKQVARDVSRVHTYLGPSIGLRVLTSAITVAIIAVTVEFTGHEGVSRQLIYVMTLWMLAHHFALLMSGLLHGLENMDWPALAEMVYKVIVVGVGVGLFLAGSGVVAYGWVMVGGAVVQSLITVAYIARLSPLRISFRPQLMKELLIGGMPFMFMGVLLSIYGHIDVVMLGFFSGDAVVGWYSAALQVYKSVEFLPMVLTTALLPTLSRLRVSDLQVLIAIARTSISVVVLAMAPVAVGLSLVSQELISFLPYPDTFQNSAPLLTILALSIPITSLLIVFGSITAAVDRQNTWAFAMLGTVALNVVLNSVGIPYFQRTMENGAIGAALATLISETFMVFVGTRLVPKEIIDRSVVNKALKVAISCAGMGVAVVMLQRWEQPLPVLVAAGAVTYAMLAFVTRAFSLSEVLFLRQAILNKVRPGTSSR